MKPKIDTQHLSVKLNGYGSSPDPIRAIWWHQHTCVAESIDWFSDKMPSHEGMARAILDQLHKGHWDVLAGAFAQVAFEGYPHAAAMQWRTHTGMGTLTTSLRYTGERFLDPIDTLDIDKLFYRAEMVGAKTAVIRYQELVASGIKKEVARDVLPCCYRQGWDCAGNLKEWLHVLDRRLLGDTQDEARHAAYDAMEALRLWCPEVIDWYEENRAFKNKLAP
jgi:thymidylate synthase (FAD)